MVVLPHPQHSHPGPGLPGVGLCGVALDGSSEDDGLERGEYEDIVSFVLPLLLGEATVGRIMVVDPVARKGAPSQELVQLSDVLYCD